MISKRLTTIITLFAPIQLALAEPTAVTEIAKTDDPIPSITDPTQPLTRLATGMIFTEGPVWLPHANKLIFSDIPNSHLMEWTEKDGLKTLRKMNHPNGNCLDHHGLVLSCQQGARNLVRLEKDGSLTILAEHFDGKKLNSPNDLALHSDGSIWFTDPSYGLKGRPPELPGRWVYRLDPTTRELTPIYKDFDMPNGIAFSPDEKRLYIADTGKDSVIRAFKIIGKTIDPKPIFTIPIRCDGMCIDTQGNIYTTAKGGIHIFKPNGKKLGLIPTPENPANVTFGGPKNQTLYITAHTSLYSIKTKATGYRSTQITQKKAVTKKTDIRIP